MKNLFTLKRELKQLNILTENLKKENIVYNRKFILLESDITYLKEKNKTLKTVLNVSLFICSLIITLQTIFILQI